MTAVSFVCAQRIEDLAAEFEQRGYSKEIIARLYEAARGVRTRGCCRATPCEGCYREVPTLDAAE
jgi:hypothetical protein